jgi:hypothetical protein
VKYSSKVSPEWKAPLAGPATSWLGRRCAARRGAPARRGSRQRRLCRLEGDAQYLPGRTDTPGAHAYWITAITFILTRRPQRDFTRTRALIQLFQWALSKGRRQASALGYVPLSNAPSTRAARHQLTEFER